MDESFSSSSSVKVKSLANYRSTFMDLSQSTDSELSWSIMSTTGVPQSITLPKVVRTFEDFIKVDIYTGDSDPVYWAIARAREGYGLGWATRFSVAMLAYYHTGVACKAADYEGKEFWDHLQDIYPTSARGSERRHFRGDGGAKTLSSMMAWSHDPDRWFNNFPLTYAGVRKCCENNLYAFGPYFQLKVCDYMDRCLGLKILSYDGLARNLPTEPGRAMALLGGSFNDLCRRVNELGLKAAPDFERPVGPAEVETSLCGWKTTKYKGNWFGADILDKREALKGYGVKGAQMAEWMPALVPKGTFRCEL
jgi:hypothetical protein